MGFSVFSVVTDIRSGAQQASRCSYCMGEINLPHVVFVGDGLRCQSSIYVLIACPYCKTVGRYDPSRVNMNCPENACNAFGYITCNCESSACSLLTRVFGLRVGLSGWLRFDRSAVCGGGHHIVQRLPSIFRPTSTIYLDEL